MPEPNTTDPQSQTTSGTDSNGQTSNPQNQTASGTQKTSIDSLPVDIQDYIARLRSEAEEANKQKKAEVKAKAAAEEQRLKEQGEFKALAEKHETRVKELEPISQSYSKLAEQINANIEAEIKDWPAEVKNLVPGIETAVEQRLEQMNRLRPLLEKLQVTARGSNPGNRPNPQIANPQAAKQAQLEANRASFSKQRGYNI